MNRTHALEFVRVTETAAIAASKWTGKGDKMAADQAAVDGMRKMLDTIDVDATVVIGEGERDEAPMLYIGEKVGNGNGDKLEIAVDPLEGTNITAAGGRSALPLWRLAKRATYSCSRHIYEENSCRS